MMRQSLCLRLVVLLLGAALAPAAAPPRAKAQAAEPMRPGNPLWAVPLEDLSATRDRPLFSPSRRPPPPVVTAAPYVPPPPPPAPPKPPNPDLALLGTVVNTTEGFGIFLDQATHAVVRLKTGERHNGWLLSYVHARAATLQKDRETVVLTLPARRSTEGAVVAPAAVSAIGEPLEHPPPRVHHDPDD